MLRSWSSTALGLALAGAAPAAFGEAAAGPPSAWDRVYLSVTGGGAFLEDASIDYHNNAAPSRRLNFNPGWSVAGAVGWQARRRLRAELEVGHRDNGLDTPAPGGAPAGSVSATTLIINGYVDLPLGGPLTPYAGAGFGKAWIAHDIVIDTGASAHTTSWPWTYQLIAGVGAPLGVRCTLGVEYRWLSGQKGLYEDSRNLFYRTRYDSHNVLITVRWRLGRG